MTRAISVLLVLSVFGCGGDDSQGNAGGAGGIGTGGTATGGAGGGGGTPTGGAGGSGGGTGGAAGASGGTGGAPSGCTAKSSGYVTDLGDHPEPALPALPSAGSSVADPTFGTRIVRLTDSTHGSECVTAYSYWPTFNATSKRLFVNCAAGGARLFDFEPTSGAPSNERPLFAKPTPTGGTPNWEDAIWSDTEPDVLYAHDTVRLWRYDVVAESYTLAKDFSGIVGGGHVRQMSKSKGDGVFGFTTQDASWGVTGCLAWRASDDKVLLEESQPGLDEVQVDKSGKWLVIKTGKSGTGVVEVRVASLETGAIIDLVDDGPDYSPGHSDNGVGTVIGADNWTNRVTFRKLDAPHTLSTVLEFGGDWTQDFHVSMRADDESRVLLSLYQSDTHTTGLFHNEIVQVATDGSASVRRLAHHRSMVGEYFDSPRANISRDGCFVAFTSTWGQSGRRDVFLLDLSE